MHQGLIDAPEYAQAIEIIEPVMEQFLSGDYDAVEVVTAVCFRRPVPDRIGLLPAGGASDGLIPMQALPMKTGDYIFHPDARSLLDSLIPQPLKLHFLDLIANLSW